ncbi:MAG: zinc-binding dehydrogenase, partial [Deltaproteobacteria bacterium]|nr:zinc-binding dehydrogenase [Deltaproteobacteria bacterium]
DINLIGVHSDGGMKEYISVPSNHLLKNNKLSPDQLAMTECLAIGAHAVRRAEISEGEKVLVVGAGPIGLGLMQFAKIAGGSVIAMDIAEERLQFAAEHLGVDFTLNAASEDIPKRLEAITDGDYPTVIFDATGNPKSMMDAFLYLAHGGRYVLVSLVMADISFPDPEFHKRETTLLSSRNATREDFLWVMDCLEKGLAVTAPMITHRCSFDTMIDNFNTWLNPESRVVKAMVEL